ncbi:hypothetical protein [Rhizobium sp. BK251]|uniref:glycine-rich domain-containing protein n=1 Tax=Rhizobium sp. BK251 TaxID=2512125 RepID=UPI00104875E5|nr:hypothetical protein [Rhizobium sp. BK251]TCL70530.1 hypothetical protein EV286_107405 [Rhizobium sp. BK251]
MPYNPSTGVYSLPPIYLAVPATVIIAQQHNDPLEDLATANNYPRPIIAGGTGSNNKTSAATELEVVSYGSSQSLVAADSARARRNIAGAYSVKSGNYTAIADDIGVPLRFTAAATLSIAAASTLVSGWFLPVFAGGGDVTIDPDGSETINGQATLTVGNGTTTTIVCDGTNFFTFSKGLRVVTQFFTTSGTYTPTPGMAFCIIEGCGGGGGGGGTNGNATAALGGGGGGGGAYSRKLCTRTDIGASQSVTIGSGGAGATSTGSTGGTTSVGTLIGAPGGVGGTQGNTGQVGLGGSGGGTAAVTSGQMTTAGSAGGSGTFSVSATLGAAIGGFGGPSVLGGGARSGGAGSSVGNGIASTGFGGGGSGGYADRNGGVGTGGNGFAGVVIITEFVAE